MALDGDRLGLAIAALFTTAGGLSASEKTVIETNWKNIANKIVNEFKNNTEFDGAECTGSTGSTAPGPHLHSIATQPVTGGIK